MNPAMNFLTRVVLCLALLGLPAPVAAMDNLEIALRSGHVMSVGWANVKGAPVWLTGRKPHCKTGFGLHVIHLDPGEDSYLHLPRGEALILRRATAELVPGDIEFWLSNGSTIAVRWPANITNDRSELRIDPPDNGRSWLVRIARPDHLGDGISVAAFVSRHDALKGLAAYQAIELEGSARRLKEIDRQSELRVWPLGKDTPTTFAAEGPARLQVETRLRYNQYADARRQVYWLRMQVDNGQPSVMRLETSPESYSRFREAGQAVVLGQAVRSFIDLPEGHHEIVMSTTADVYLRPMVSGDDLLVPSLNRSRPAPGEILDELERRRAAMSAETTIAGAATSAFNAATENRRREPALNAAAELERLERPDIPEIGAATVSLRTRHSFFRQVMPAAAPHFVANPSRIGRFAPPRLFDPDQVADPPPEIVAESLMKDAVEGLALAYFSPIPAGRTFRYALPPRGTKSNLRLVIAKPESMEAVSLMIHLGSSQIFEIRSFPALEAAAARLRTPPAMAALAALAADDRQWSRLFDAPLLRVGTVELPLPVSVDVINIQQLSEGQGDPSVALFYRSSKRYSLDENALIELAKWRDGDDPVAASAALTELANHCIPLARRLVALSLRFRHGVAPLPMTTTMAEQIPDEDIEVLTDSGQWLAALEALSRRLARNSEDANAAFERVEALRHLGEHFLAERQLRGLMLFHPHQLVREAAFRQLTEFEKIHGDNSTATALAAAWLVGAEADAEVVAAELASRVFAQPVPVPDRNAVRGSRSATDWSRLAELLLAENFSDEALVVASTSGPSAPTLLESACQLGWWRIFDQAFNTVTTEPERSYWRGRRALAQGEFDEAEVFLSAGGKFGRELADHLRWGRSIRIALSSSDTATRASAVLDWERWLNLQPGHRVWRQYNEATLHSGANLLYSIERDLLFNVFEVGPEAPLKLNVPITGRVRLEVRPLLENEKTNWSDDALVIQQGPLVRVVPVSAGRPVAGLEVIGLPNWSAGYESTVEVETGPGLDEMSLTSRSGRLLVRASTTESAVLSGVLPPMTRQAVHNILNDPSTKLGFPQSRQKLYFVTRDGAEIALPRPGTVAQSSPRTQLDLSDLDPVLRARAGLRLGWKNRVDLNPLLDTDEVDLGEKLIAAATAGDIEQVCHYPESDISPEQRRLSAGACLAAGDVNSALTVDLGDDAEAIIRRLELMVLAAETDPGRKAEMAVAGLELGIAHATSPEFNDALAPLLKGSTWSDVDTIIGGTGIRLLPVDHWRPRSPALRIRRALLPPHGLFDRVLFGDRKLAIELVNVQPSALHLEIEAYELEYQVPLPIDVILQVDDGPEQHHEIVAGRPQVVTLDLGSGAHAVTLKLFQPRVNSFVRVALDENGDSQRAALLENALTVRRRYHVVTVDNPLKIGIDGPAWLRIDEYRPHGDLVTYRAVDSGWHEVEIGPGEGQQQTMLRVASRQFGDAEKTISQSLVERALNSVSWSDFSLEPNVSMPSGPNLVALERDESGSPSGSLILRQRRLFDEDDDLRIQTEQFIELRATHKKLVEYHSLHHEVSMLGRLRRHGNPSFGALGDLRLLDLPLNLSLRLSGSLFVQQPGTTLTGEPSGTEWAATIRARVQRSWSLGPRTEHIASGSVFTRRLSLDENDLYSGQDLDQDIYTTYKSDHLRGFNLAETIRHQPWRDTLWSAGVALVGNERLNDGLDQVRFGLNWKQLFGAVQLDVGYDVRRYLADSDRLAAYTRQVLKLGVAGDHWVRQRYRLGYGLVWRRDLKRASDDILLFVTLTSERGRPWRNEAPGTADFLSLRRERAMRIDDEDDL